MFDCRLRQLLISLAGILSTNSCVDVVNYRVANKNCVQYDGNCAVELAAHNENKNSADAHLWLFVLYIINVISNIE